MVRALALRPHGGERGHGQRHHHVDLVRLLVLRDAPTARALDRDGATDGETDVDVGIDGKVAALDKVVEVLARLGEVGKRFAETPRS